MKKAANIFFAPSEDKHVNRPKKPQLISDRAHFHRTECELDTKCASACGSISELEKTRRVLIREV